MNNSKNMTSIDDKYFELSKTFLSLLGIWPTESDLKRRVKMIVYIVLLTSFIIPQVFIFFTKLFESLKIIIATIRFGNSYIY